jgi:hypothetical protein
MTQQIRGIIDKIISMQVNGTSTYLFTLRSLHEQLVYKAVFVEPSQTQAKKSSGFWDSDLPPGAETANPVYDDQDSSSFNVLKLKLGFLSEGALVQVTLQSKDAEELSEGHAPDFDRQIAIVDIDDNEELVVVNFPDHSR